MTLTVYGIRQCDSCRKALKWLSGQDLPHRFHDLREDGLARARVKTWLASPFADRLVNRRSTTWRELSDEQKEARGKDLENLLLAHPTLVKRPVFENGPVIAVGFDPDTLKEKLGR